MKTIRKYHTLSNFTGNLVYSRMSREDITNTINDLSVEVFIVRDVSGFLDQARLIEREGNPVVGGSIIRKFVVLLNRSDYEKFTG